MKDKLSQRLTPFRRPQESFCRLQMWIRNKISCQPGHAGIACQFVARRMQILSFGRLPGRFLQASFGFIEYFTLSGIALLILRRSEWCWLESKCDRAQIILRVRRACSSAGALRPLKSCLAAILKAKMDRWACERQISSDLESPCDQFVFQILPAVWKVSCQARYA